MKTTIKVILYTYEVIKGKFKGKTVDSYECNLFKNPNCPISATDGESGYVLFCGELKLISQKEVEGEVDLPDGMTPEEAVSIINTY